MKCQVLVSVIDSFDKHLCNRKAMLKVEEIGKSKIYMCDVHAFNLMKFIRKESKKFVRTEAN